MSQMVRESHSVEETEAIAADVAATLRGGECIALEGDLGAGKTQFVRGLVRALGGNPRAVILDPGRNLEIHGRAHRDETRWPPSTSMVAPVM